MKATKYILMVISMVCALGINAQPQTEQPQVQFQSTSTLQGSGSAYSSNPSLNADGTAAYSPAAASTPNQAPSGPRKVAPKDGSGKEYPLGDALLPLALMAMLYIGVIYLRRRKIAHGDAQHK